MYLLASREMSVVATLSIWCLSLKHFKPTVLPVNICHSFLPSLPALALWNTINWPEGCSLASISQDITPRLPLSVVPSIPLVSSPFHPAPTSPTEHKELRSCSGGFSLMLMHILSLLHTNVSDPASLFAYHRSAFAPWGSLHSLTLHCWCSQSVGLSFSTKGICQLDASDKNEIVKQR